MRREAEEKEKIGDANIQSELSSEHMGAAGQAYEEPGETLPNEAHQLREGALGFQAGLALPEEVQMKLDKSILTDEKKIFASEREGENRRVISDFIDDHKCQFFREFREKVRCQWPDRVHFNVSRWRNY